MPCPYFETEVVQDAAVKSTHKDKVKQPCPMMCEKCEEEDEITEDMETEI